MPEGVVKKRFVESPVGKVAGFVLALLWVASMCVVDAHAYSALPYAGGLCVVVVLALLGVLSGLKFVRIPMLAWVALGVGGYFLARSEHSYAVVESWRESALIVSCGVFYVAGVYAGQMKRNRGLVWVLALALFANMVAFVVMRHVDSELCWLGRPTMSLTGPNSPYVTLFLYKNFAALFLAMGGAALLWFTLWKGRWSASAVLQAMLGVGAVAASFFCGSRVVWLVLPVVAVVGWVLWLVLRLYAGQRIGVWTVLVGLLLITLVGTGVYGLCFGDLLQRIFAGVDTHLRYQIWSDLCRVIPDAPAWGYGVGASQWEIVPVFNEWHTPNFAHNEYLQAWVDYGPIGALLLLGVLGAHLCAGGLTLVSEQVDATRRHKVALAMLVLAVVAVAAATDFVWHDFSLASLSAFCCGLLASPRVHAEFSWKTLGRRWAEGSGPRMVPVRAQGLMGKCVFVLLAGGVLAGAWKFYERTSAAWLAQWTYDEMVRKETPTPELRDFLGQVVQHYPDPGVMDCYALLPYDVEPDWEKMEALLWQVHHANPKQLFTVVMLAEVMDRRAKCVEVEKLLRRHYVGDGMKGTMLTAWPSYYSMNLLQWAQQEFNKGNLGRARSMFNYAFRVGRFMPLTAWRNGVKRWTEGGSPRRRAFVDICRADAAMLNAMNVPEDHSWQQPLEPAGKPSLYRRWGVPADSR
ncbi:MAG: O-antigen ligase family protein [Akkermansia sp.]|nr:O-antigen ligase family protein [Akkermansia sp.]